MKYVHTGKPCFIFLKTPPNFSRSLPLPTAIGANVTSGLGEGEENCRLRVFFIVALGKQTQNPYCLSGEAAIQNLVLLRYFEPCVKDLKSFWRLPSCGLLMALLYLVCCYPPLRNFDQLSCRYNSSKYMGKKTAEMVERRIKPEFVSGNVSIQVDVCYAS